jgi:DNA-binding MarR family transcriptional regulator
MSEDSVQDHTDPVAPGRAMSALREVMRAFNVATKKLERRFGISGAQLETLEILKETPGLSPSDIACRTSTDQSTASVVVKRLTESGFVERRHQDGDRRRTNVTLTAAGERLLEQAPPSIPSRLRQGFVAMPTMERMTLTALLERWLVLAGLRRA